MNEKVLTSGILHYKPIEGLFTLILFMFGFVPEMYAYKKLIEISLFANKW